MSKFVQRALQKLPKLSTEQIHDLVSQLSGRVEKLELVLDSMSEGVVVANLQNQVLLANKAAERLFLLPGIECPQDFKIWELIRYEAINRYVREAMDSQDSFFDREFAVEDKGTHRTLNCRVVPLVQKGAIEGTILTIEDITRRKQREAKLRRYESLASLTTLAAGVAHEIKNPLGSIGIHMQLIEKKLQAVAGSEQLKQYAAVVNEEVERLNKIVVDFLFAVRPMDIQPVDSDLGEVVHDLLHFVQYELEQHRIALQVDIPEDLPLLQVDERYIKQAVLNMIKNAIAAMPNGGTLTIRIFVEAENILTLQIIDTGLGMDEKTQNRIFEPYFTTRDFGSGLGLTLVYKIIKEHRGEIVVYSRPGEGANFTVHFPIPQRRRELLDWQGDSANEV